MTSYSYFKRNSLVAELRLDHGGVRIEVGDHLVTQRRDCRGQTWVLAVRREGRDWIQNMF